MKALKGVGGIPEQAFWSYDGATGLVKSRMAYDPFARLLEK